MLEYKDILTRIKMDDSNVVNAYAYGSRIYGTHTAASDYDFVFVVRVRENEQFSDNLININFFTEESHQQRLDEHEISALECQFVDSAFILKESKKFNFKLDLSKLRHSLSRKASNSWVKCKKKLTVPADYDFGVGRKSMFHSFRILDYGIQIAKDGKISDYGSCNALFQEIMSYYDWESLYDTFKVKHNAVSTNFRTVTHK